jgi:hypothetical protein
MFSDEYNNLYTFIQGLIDNKIDEYDFLQKFLKRIQSKDSWKDYTIEQSIENVIGGRDYVEMFARLPPTISKAVSHNNSFSVYFYDDVFDKWYGIVTYTKPTSFAIGYEEPFHNEQFTMKEFK